MLLTHARILLHTRINSWTIRDELTLVILDILAAKISTCQIARFLRQINTLTAGTRTCRLTTIIPNQQSKNVRLPKIQSKSRMDLDATQLNSSVHGHLYAVHKKTSGMIELSTTLSSPFFAKFHCNLTSYPSFLLFGSFDFGNMRLTVSLCFKVRNSTLPVIFSQASEHNEIRTWQ